jgi:hypothetical protein
MNGQRAVRDAACRMILPAVVAGCLAVPPLLLRQRLPDPVAVRWGLAGMRAVPWYHLPLWLWTGGSAALWCLAWAALKPLAPPFPRQRERAAGVYTLAGLLLTAQVLILGTNTGHQSWHQAGVPTATLAAITGAGLALTLAARGAGAMLAGAAQPAAPPPQPHGARAPGQRMIWSGGARNRLAWAVAAAIALVATVAGSSVAHLIAGLAAAAVLAVFSAVGVVAGPGGVTATLGPWHWPRRHVPITEIEAATSFELMALAYRGWGLRRLPGGSAWIVRSGDALELALRNGRRFVVTVDQAAQAAALVNEHLPAQ